VSRLRGKRYLSVEDFAALIGLTQRIVRRACETNRLRTRPGHVPGGRWQILRSEVERVKRRGL